MTCRDPDCIAHGHHTWRDVWRNVASDIDRCLTASPQTIQLGSGFKRRLSAFLRPEIQSLLAHRISHYLRVNGWCRVALIVARLNLIVHKVNITPQSCIGPGCRLPHPAGVMFHGRAGTGLTMFSLAVCCPSDNCLEGPVETGPQIGNRVTIGAHAVVLGAVSVGSDARIPQTVCVDRNCPAGTIAVTRALRPSRRTKTAAL